jgi:hypothetical protein
MRPRPAIATAVLIAVGVVIVQALLVPLFSAPAAHLAPRDLPVIVAGPVPATAQLSQQLAQKEPGAFAITTKPDAAAADRALRDRKAYAAFVVDPAAAPVVALHTASGASPTVALLLTQAATRLDPQIEVTDVVPGDATDPRGAGFAAGFLPLALTAMLAGFALVLAVRSRTARAAGILTFGILAGLAGATVLQTWLGVIGGTFLLNAGVIALFATAVTGAVAGLGSLLGRPGLGLGALLVFLVGNPLSGVAAAPELLPQPWGALGQYLPIGAGGTLLRSSAFFDGAGGAKAAGVLAAYATVGLILVLVSPARAQGAHEPVARAPQVDGREPALNAG